MLLFIACTEYGVTVDDKPVDDTMPTDTETDPVIDSGTTVTDTDRDTAEITIATEPCTDVSLSASTQWWGSQPFTTEADVTDPSGRAYHSVDFDLTDWSTVSMPDSGHTPAGSDKAYRGVVNIPAMPERLFVDLQTDDGITLYVNGSYVGQWGGGWQEEGCVNDEANCTVTTPVEPVEVTAYVKSGDNVFAARVSNAIDNSYFMLHAYCAAE